MKAIRVQDTLSGKLSLNVNILNIYLSFLLPLGLSKWLSGKRTHLQCRRCRRCGFDSLVGKIPWRRAWQPTQVYLPGESQGQRYLVGTVHRVSKSQTQLEQLSTNKGQDRIALVCDAQPTVCMTQISNKWHSTLYACVYTDITHIYDVVTTCDIIYVVRYIQFSSVAQS